MGGKSSYSTVKLLQENRRTCSQSGGNYNYQLKLKKTFKIVHRGGLKHFKQISIFTNGKSKSPPSA